MNKVIKVLQPALVTVTAVVDEINFIDTRNSETMAKTVCNGHDGTLGYDNPKASIRCGNKIFLLCKSCWQSQGILEKDGS